MTEITDPRDITNAEFVDVDPYGQLDADGIPQGGDTWRYGDWTTSLTTATRERATHILVPYTDYSDYSGSTVEASNYRSLLRDYPDTFVDVHGGHGTRALLLPVDWTPPDDGRAGLLDELESLSGYPVYDEEDQSEYERELTEDAWDAYLSHDVIRDLDDTLNADAGEGAEIDPLAHYSLERLREAYYTLTYEQNYGPECEDAVSAYFPFHDDVVATIAQRIRDAVTRDFELLAADLTREQIPGQDELAT